MSLKKNIMIHLLLLMIGVKTFSQTIAWDWSLNSSSQSMSNCTSIATDKNKNSYVLGFYQDSVVLNEFKAVSGNTNSTNLFIVKIDSTGSVKWLKSILTTGNIKRGSIAVDGIGNVYVASSFSSGIEINGTKLLSTTGTDAGFVIKYSNDGEILKMQKIESSGMFLYNIKVDVDKDYNIYVGGNFEKSLTIDTITIKKASDWDTYLFCTKLDSTFHPLWIKDVYVDNMAMFGLNDMSVDENGNSYVAGTTGCQINFGNDTILNKNRRQIVFIAKYDSEGKILWSKSSSDNSLCECFSISKVKSKYFYVTGMHLSGVSFGKDTLNAGGDNGEDIFIAKMDTAGNFIKSKSYHSFGSKYDTGLSIEPDQSTQGAYLLGLYSDTLVGGNDTLISVADPTSTYLAYNVFLAKVDSSLNVSWLRSAGLQGNRSFGEIAVIDSNIYLAGYNVKMNSFRSSNILKSAGIEEITKAFIAKSNSNKKSEEIYTGAKKNNNVLSQTLLYPNPVNNMLNVKLPQNLTGILKVYNIEGVLLETIRINSSDLKQIDFTKMTNGIYIIEISSNNLLERFKLIKQ